VRASNSPNAKPASTNCAPHFDSFERELVALIPNLRAFSRLLCRNKTLAEDLAQEALVKAWHARKQFKTGTNLRAWLFTILRNSYYSYARQSWREPRWVDNDQIAEQIEVPPREQEWAMELSDTVRALNTLPGVQRDALILVGAGGLTYQDAATICGTSLGTLKSRVARGRVTLLHRLDSGKPLACKSLESGVEAVREIQDRISALSSNEAGRPAH